MEINKKELLKAICHAGFYFGPTARNMSTYTVLIALRATYSAIEGAGESLNRDRLLGIVDMFRLTVRRVNRAYLTEEEESYLDMVLTRLGEAVEEDEEEAALRAEVEANQAYQSALIRAIGGGDLAPHLAKDPRWDDFMDCALT